MCVQGGYRCENAAEVGGWVDEHAGTQVEAAAKQLGAVLRGCLRASGSEKEKEKKTQQLTG